MSINRDDIAVLMRGVAPPIMELVTRLCQPLADRIVTLEDRIAELEGKPPRSGADESAQRSIEGH